MHIGTPEGFARYVAALQHQQTARKQQLDDDNLRNAVTALCDYGFQMMRQQAPAMMSRVNYDDFMSVLTPFILARQ